MIAMLTFYSVNPRSVIAVWMVVVRVACRLCLLMVMLLASQFQLRVPAVFFFVVSVVHFFVLMFRGVLPPTSFCVLPFLVCALGMPAMLVVRLLF